MVEEALVHGGHGVGAGEGELTGEHFIEDDADGIDVGPAIAALAFDLLGRDVIGGADGGGEVGVSEAAGGCVAGYAEVDELDVVVVVDHDVFRLEVAVNDAIGMDVLERIENADGDVDGALLRDAAFSEDVAEEAAGDPLHDHVHAGAFLSAEDAHDLGVVKFFADAAFALEPVEEDGIGFEIGVGDFEGDDAVVTGVDGAIDGGHAAAGDRGFNDVRVELRAGLQAVEKTHGAACSKGTLSMVSGNDGEDVKDA